MKIGYCRVSTSDQDINAQIIELSNFGCSRIVSDVKSGVKFRKELDNLLNNVLRKGDTLVVFRLDRLGRSLSDLLNIFHILNDKGINFVSLSEKIDTTTPQGKLLFSISGAFAEYERTIIQERTNLGLRNAVSKGVNLGRPKGIVSNEKAMLAYQLKHRDNKTANDIAQLLNIGYATVYRYLKVAEKHINK